MNYYWKVCLMEEGKDYNVYYQDEDRVRHKKLVFKVIKEGLIEFYNEKSKKPEYLPVSRIMRIEGLKEDGKEDNNSLHRERD